MPWPRLLLKKNISIFPCPRFRSLARFVCLSTCFLRASPTAALFAISISPFARFLRSRHYTTTTTMPVSTRSRVTTSLKEPTRSTITSSSSSVSVTVGFMSTGTSSLTSAVADGDNDDAPSQTTSSTPSTPAPKGSRRVKQETTPVSTETKTETQAVTPSPAKAATKRKSAVKKEATPPKKKIKANPSEAGVARAPPKDWQEIYTLVEELRQDRTAPCDHSGCEALPDSTCADPAEYRFQVLFSLMLSSQTKDAVVAAAVRAMQADGVLNVRAISQMEPSVLQGYISKVGFHNNKTKYIKESVEILLEKYGGDIPRTAAAMIVDLPGVGPKMAYICESVAWRTQSGIGVDTHMHRLFHLLKWVDDGNGGSKTPEKTRVHLQSWLPVSYWADVNLLWVGFGQEVQQDKPKILRKALACSRPAEALRLLKRCGLDYNKVGKELGLMEDIQLVIALSKSDSVQAAPLEV